MLDAFLDLFAPESCVGCRAPGSILCARCAGGIRQATPGTNSSNDKGVAPHATGWPSAPTELHITGCASVTAPWVYEGRARELVLALKLRGQRGAARPLGNAIAAAVGRGRVPAQVATWVPARRHDIAARGLDHGHAIARHAAGALGLPLHRLLEWTGDRSDQAGLGRAHRELNLRGAFRAAAVDVAVLVIDDLVTTGATLGAAAEALARAGAPRVDAAAACRA